MADYNPQRGRQLNKAYVAGTIDPMASNLSDEDKKTLYQYRIDNNLFDINKFKPETVKKYGLTAPKTVTMTQNQATTKAADSIAEATAQKKESFFDKVKSIIPKAAPKEKPQPAPSQILPSDKIYSGATINTIPTSSNVGFSSVLQSRIKPQENVVNERTFPGMVATGTTPRQAIIPNAEIIQIPKIEQLRQKEAELNKVEQDINANKIEMAEKDFYLGKIDDKQYAKALGYQPMSITELEKKKQTWSENEYEDYLNKKEKYINAIQTKLNRPNVAIQKGLEPTKDVKKQVETNLEWNKDWENVDKLREQWRTWTPEQKDDYYRKAQQRLDETGSSFINMTDEFAAPRIYSDIFTDAWEKGLKITNVGEITEGILKSRLETLLSLEKYKKRMGQANKVEDLENYIAAHPELEISKKPKTLSPKAILRGGAELIGQMGTTTLEALPGAGAGAVAGGAYAGLGGNLTGIGALLPEEIVTIPAGALYGAGKGQQIAMFEIMRRMEEQNAYDEMIEAGVSEKEAEKVSKVVGLVNGALELAQFDEVLKLAKTSYKAAKAGKEVAKKVVLKDVVDKAMGAAAKQALFAAKETGQEVTQETVTAIGLATAMATIDAENGKETSEEVVKDYIKRLTSSDEHTYKSALEDAKNFLINNKDRLSETAIRSFESFLGTGLVGGGTSYVAGKAPQVVEKTKEAIKPKEQKAYEARVEEGAKLIERADTVQDTIEKADKVLRTTDDYKNTFVELQNKIKTAENADEILSDRRFLEFTTETGMKKEDIDNLILKEKTKLSEMAPSEQKVSEVDISSQEQKTEPQEAKTDIKTSENANLSVKYQNENKIIDSMILKDVSKNKPITELIPETNNYIKERLRDFKEELEIIQKGEKIYIRGEDGSFEVTGQKRNVSDTIAAIKDTTKASYRDIINATELIEKGGKLNALAKKILVYFDEDLISGYSTMGREVKPNDEYRALRGKEAYSIKEEADSEEFRKDFIADMIDDFFSGDTKPKTKTKAEKKVAVEEVLNERPDSYKLLVDKISRMKRKNFDKKQTLKLIEDLYKSAKNNNVDVDLVLNFVDKFETEITEDMLKEHGIAKGSKAYIAGRSFIEQNGDVLKLTAEVLNDKENFIQQEVVHEFAELYVETFRKNNKEEFDSIVKELQDNAQTELSYADAREMIVELMTDRKLQKEVVEMTDIPTSKVMKFINQFVDWFKGVSRRIKFYKEQVWGKLPAELQKHADLFAEGNWDEVFKNIKEEVYSDKKDSEGTLLTNSQEDFFKNSKAIDKDGNLLKLYHGTGFDFNEFANEKTGSNYQDSSMYGKGFYFTTNKNSAKVWAEKSKGSKNNIYEVYLNIEKPFNLNEDYSDLFKEYDEFVTKKGYRILEKMTEDNVNIQEELIKKGFDGIFGDNERIVAFKPNQIKLTSNLNPTESVDIRYSIKETNTDSKEFKSWFKDSKVVDSEGNPEIVYHGTKSDFNEFKSKFMGETGTAEGRGFYFTNKETIAKMFTDDKEIIIEAYLSIQKPLSRDKITISKKELEKLIRKLDPTGDNYLSNYGDVKREGYNKVLKEALDSEYEYSVNDVDLLNGIYNAFGETFDTFFGEVRKTLGYDGIIVRRPDWGDGQSVYIVFESNQIKSPKNVGTFDPNNADIRYSTKEQMADPILQRYIDVFGGKEEFTEEDATIAEEKGRKIRGKMDTVSRLKMEKKLDKEISKIETKEKIREMKEVARYEKQTAISKIKTEEKNRFNRYKEQQKIKLDKQKNEAMYKAMFKKIEKMKKQASKKLLERLKYLKSHKDKFYPFARDAAEELLKGLDLKAMNMRSKVKLDKSVEFFNKMKEEDPTYEIPEGMRNKISRLNNTFIGDMEIDDIKAMQDAVDHIIRTQELKKTLVNKRSMKALDEAATEALETIGVDNSEWLDSAKVGFEKFKKAAGDLKSYYFLGSLSPRNLALVLSNQKESGVLYKYLFEDLNKAQRESVEKLQKIIYRFDEFHEGIDLRGWSSKDKTATFLKPQKIKEYFERKKNLKQDIPTNLKNREEIKLPSGNIYLSKMEKISLYLHSLNEDNVRHLVEGGGRIEDRRNPYKFTNSDIDFIRSDNFLSEEERKIANGFYDFFNNTAKSLINSASLNLDGFERANINNYFPIVTDKREMDTDYSKFMRKIVLEGNKHLKERTKGAANPILLEDALEVFERHAQFVSDYSSYAMPLRNAKLLLGQHDIKNALEEKYGKEISNIFRDLFKDIEGDNNIKNPLTKFFFKITANAQRAILGYNPWIVLQQVSAIPLAAAEIDSKYITQGMTKKVDESEMLNNSPLLWIRSLGMITRETRELERQKISERRGFFDHSTDAIFKMDSYTMSVIWRAVKEEMKDTHPNLIEGTSEYYDVLAERAESIITKTQPFYTVMQRSHIGRTKDPFLRLMTLFSTQTNTNFNIMIETINKFKKGDVKGGLQGLFAMSISNIVFATINTARTKWRDYDDDKDKNNLEIFMENFINGWTGMFYIVGNMVNFIQSGLGDKTLTEDTIYKLISSASEIVDVTNEKTFALRLRNFLRATAQISGIPVGNIEKELDNAIKQFNKPLYSQYQGILYKNPMTRIQDRDAQKIAKERKEFKESYIKELEETGESYIPEKEDELEKLATIDNLNKLDRRAIKEILAYPKADAELQEGTVQLVSEILEISEEDAYMNLANSKARRKTMDILFKRISDRSKKSKK